MKRAWSIVLVVVFITILLGAIAVGVGYLTGANLELVYDTLGKSPLADYLQRLMGYWDTAFAWGQKLFASVFGAAA